MTQDQILAVAVKLAIIGVLAPVWWPFLRAVWAEVEGSLRPEGGLFGRPPTRTELERLEARKGAYVMPLDGQRRDEVQARRGSAGSSAAGSGPTPARGVRTTRRRGF